MLSDEEKEVIEEIKNKKADYFMISNLTGKTLLNLIEKQSKEIEEYKKQLDLDYVDKHFVPVERYNQLEKEIEELKEIIKENTILVKDENGDYQELNIDIKNYISKDKIKAKIEEVDYKMIAHQDVRLAVKVALNSLLEKG